jgi:hypothetical protein
MSKEGGSEEASTIMMNHADGDDGDDDGGGGGGGGGDGWLTSATREMMAHAVARPRKICSCQAVEALTLSHQSTIPCTPASIVAAAAAVEVSMI